MRRRRTVIVLLAGVAAACGGAAALAASVGYEFLSTSPLEEKSQEQVILEGARKALNRQYEETFSLAEGLDEKKWFHVDLTKAANVNLFGSEGQTTPVRYPYMQLGRQVFYGVPFAIIDPAKNDNRTAIALPSKRLLPRELPAKATVQVGRKAAVLYFLHATYYTTNEGKQSFTITYADGSAETIDFVGTVHSGDWYHQHTRIYTENVHYVLVPAAKGSKTFHRNMHILQWRNPHPDKEIASITFASDPDAPMAILVVAVTGHAGPLRNEGGQ